MESKSNTHSFCVIIPMFNEEKGAAICVDKVEKELKKINHKSTLIVSNDGSTDNTPAILSKKKQQYREKLIIVSSKKNQGYGKALQLAVTEAVKRGFEFGLFMDSDLTNDPKFIVSFMPFLSKKVDCVKASRYIHGGKVIDVPTYRRIISIVGNKFASWCFRVGVKDCTNGFKMVRLSMLKNVAYKEFGFAIILEEMYILTRMHARFIEIPTTLSARKNTKSHFSYNLKTFFNYGKYPLKALLHL